MPSSILFSLISGEKKKMEQLLERLSATVGSFFSAAYYNRDYYLH